MTSLKYNLKQITDISYSGFNFKIPEDTHSIINYLCLQVGSSCINSNVFIKLEPSVAIPVVKNTNELKKKICYVKLNAMSRSSLIECSKLLNYHIVVFEEIDIFTFKKSRN